MHYLALFYNYNSYNTSMTTHHSFPVVFLLISLILLIFEVIILWKIFLKAGRPGWAAIIPFYNLWVLLEISDYPGWLVLLSLLGIIPIIGFLASIALLVIYILAMLNLARHFGKSTVFAVVGLIIFSIIGLAILAFGDAKYTKKIQTV